jgi:(4-(4-[2-(gamma-L-glutamylamino)ethyl]phenoxymethyl)furan-2-yl)methanamine synthase
MQVIGLDIGGANLKAADLGRRAVSIPFPVWREPDRLSEKLVEILAQFPKAEMLAVTMTAELADCFRTKREGVDRILASVEAAAGPLSVVVWQTGGEFVSPEVARDTPLLVAAGNWHALATWLGRVVPTGAALLIDIGSTTTDVIPLLDGVPVSEGLTDSERLLSGELVYTGVRRTPVCAVTNHVPFRGSECPLAAELFATTLDVYLTLGDVAENADKCDTANGKPATRECAADRLARAICCDVSEVTEVELHSIAMHVAAAQRETILRAVVRVLERFQEPCGQLIISGSGSFLAEQVVREVPQLRELKPIRLTEIFAADIAEAACAFAVANLASEREGV